MRKERLIAPDIVEGICLDCKQKYEVFSFGSYGGTDWPVRCSKCGKIKWSGGTDTVFETIMKDFKEKYGNIYADIDGMLSANVGIFIDKFQESCDPCECGGRFKLVMSQICPNCGSRKVEINWSKVIRNDKMSFEKVSHDKYLKGE